MRPAYSFRSSRLFPSASILSMPACQRPQRRGRRRGRAQICYTSHRRQRERSVYEYIVPVRSSICAIYYVCTTLLTLAFTVATLLSRLSGSLPLVFVLSRQFAFTFNCTTIYHDFV